MRKANRVSLPADIATYVDGLDRRHRPLFILLFGSHARGAAGRFSDHDLLVVADLPADSRERQALLWAEKPAWADVVAFTPDELGRLLYRGLVLDALLEGVLLRGDNAAFQEWRRRAQTYVQDRGLRKTPWGYFRKAA